MAFVSKVPRYFLAIVLTLITLETLNLHAMEPERAPSFGVGIGQACQHLAYKRVCRICDQGLSAALLSTALSRVGVSLCDIKDNKGRLNSSALNEAASHGYTNIVKVILAVADKFYMTSNLLFTRQFFHEGTALHCATFNGHAETLETLLLAVGKLDAETAWKLLATKDSYGRTALWMAANYCHPGCVKLILTFAHKLGKAWELIMIIGEKGQTAFDCASLEIKQIMEQYRPLY